jgi:hypothetical protein
MATLPQRAGAMQPAHGSKRHLCAVTSFVPRFDQSRAGNQKPGAELRPGANHQFQFPE